MSIVSDVSHSKIGEDGVPDIDFRASARGHLKCAQALLLTESDQSARYACLELRMAIEALTYQLLQAHLAEVPNSVMEKWTPKRVIDELLAIDPDVDKSREISIGIQETPGVPSKKIHFLGEYRRFSVKWANKAHNSLGFFLHEATIDQHKKRKHNSGNSIRVKANEIVAELDAILGTTIYNVNIGRFVEFECECGFHIKRKDEVLKNCNTISCGDCGLQYKCTFDIANDRYEFVRDRVFFNCPSCTLENGVDTHTLHTLPIIKCACGIKFQVENHYRLRTSNSELPSTPNSLS